jgi:hypothetical protein
MPEQFHLKPRQISIVFGVIMNLNKTLKVECEIELTKNTAA